MKLLSNTLKEKKDYYNLINLEESLVYHKQILMYLMELKIWLFALYKDDNTISSRQYCPLIFAEKTSDATKKMINDVKFSKK